MAYTYLWDFGDGNTSTEKSPTHIYENEGTYTVSLTVANGPDIVQETKIDYIHAINPVVPDVHSKK